MKPSKSKGKYTRLSKNRFSQGQKPAWTPTISKDVLGYADPPHQLAPNLKHRIITQYEAVLFKIETIILDIAQTQHLPGEEVLNVLARLLWVHECRLHGTKDQLDDIRAVFPLTNAGIHLYRHLIQKIPPYVKTFADRKTQKKHRNFSPTTILWQCFEVVFDSCRYWMHQDGPQGYLEYIEEFMIPDESLFDDTFMALLEDEFDKADLGMRKD